MTAVIVGILSSSIRLATPYLFAAIGETLSQASGVMNLGLDGIMMMGAYAAFFAAVTTGSLGVAVLVAAAVGGVFGVLMAVVTVSMRADQGVSGIALYLFCLGLSELLFKQTLGGVRTISGLPPLHIPGLSSIPVVGKIFFQHNILVYVAFALVPIVWFVLNKTPFGLKIRSVVDYVAKLQEK